MRLKVALLNDSFPPTIDGVANATLNYADILTRHHHCDTTVITPKYPGVVDNYPFSVYRYHSIPTPQRIGYRAGDPISPLAIKNLRQMRFDIVHTHCPFVSALVANEMVMGRRRRSPVIFTYHTKFGIDIDNRFKGEAFRTIAKKFVLQNIYRSDEVWVVSEGAGKDLRQLGYEGGFRVMENGTDFPRVTLTREQRDAFHQRHNLTEDRLMLLFVGRMMWYKNIRLILDGLKIAREAGLKFSMYFVGDGYDLPEIQQYSHDLGLDSCVYFPGKVTDRDELKTYFGRSNLFLFPSTYDTSGLVVKEAAACDTPSLLVRGSCAAEGVTDGQNGFLCEETAEDFAKVLLAATENRQKLTEVGISASKEIYLSWEDAIDRAYRRYVEVVEAWPYSLPYRKI